jgi:hypothetical protein
MDRGISYGGVEAERVDVDLFLDGTTSEELRNFSEGSKGSIYVSGLTFYSWKQPCQIPVLLPTGQ